MSFVKVTSPVTAGLSAFSAARDPAALTIVASTPATSPILRAYIGSVLPCAPSPRLILARPEARRREVQNVVIDRPGGHAEPDARCEEDEDLRSLPHSTGGQRGCALSHLSVASVHCLRTRGQ